MRSEAVFSCVRVRSETLASLPLIVYKRLPDGGKERAPYHPLYRVLHDRPNRWQTSLEFREMMQSHLDLRGNAYAQIVAGSNGPIDQLLPIHPDRVQVKRYQDGTFDYTVRMLNGTNERFLPDEIFHLRGWSLDGVTGLSPISVMREVVGIDIAAQDYAARFLANDATPSIVLKHPSALDDKAYRRLKESWQEQQTGKNRGSAAILEENMDVKALGITNKDAQFIEARKYQKSQIAAIFRVPPHMIGELDRATHSNIEHQGIEFTIYTMLPIAKRWEQAVTRDLFFPLPDDETEYFAEFLLDGLNRGDMDSRYTAYAIGRNWGWLSVNDIRRLENMNPITGGDEYLRPLNMTPAGTPGPDDQEDEQQNSGNSGAGPAPQDEQEESASAQRMRLFALAESAASRMIRKETAALSKLLEKHRGYSDRFCNAVASFYLAHKDVLSDALRIQPVAAAQYCDSNSLMLCQAAKAGKWEQAAFLVKSFECNTRLLAQIAMGLKVTEVTQ